MALREVSQVRNDDNKRLDQNDPVIIDLLQRVSRLEARVDGLEKTLNALNDKIGKVEESTEKIDEKVWYILAGILVSIAIEVLVTIIR
jgi:uncharacterized coiled-coil protein SlyX